MDYRHTKHDRWVTPAVFNKAISVAKKIRNYYLNCSFYRNFLLIAIKTAQSATN